MSIEKSAILEGNVSKVYGLVRLWILKIDYHILDSLDFNEDKAYSNLFTRKLTGLPNHWFSYQNKYEYVFKVQI